MTVLTTELRREILSIPEEHLALANDHEIQLYRDCLEVELALSAPLEYMKRTSSMAREFKHIVLLNEWMLALEEGRLYFDGPGPEPVRLHESAERVRPFVRQWVHGYDDDGWAYEEDGEDEYGNPNRVAIYVHPTRGDRPVYNLGIDMPPRHGKSFFVSEHHPAYFLTKYPDYQLILASYEAEFAAEWGEKARDHINEYALPGIRVRGGKQAAKNRWRIEGHRGEMKTAGAGGPVTGKGGHWIIIDDPVKNAEEAMSETVRQKTHDWFISTIYTRREIWNDGTPGRVVIMATRWHEDDLAGRVVPEVPQIGDRWARLHLQAIFEPTSSYPECPLGRKPGEALCPARMPLRELHEIREQSELWFNALYQGDPFVSDGNLIHRPFNEATLKDGVYEMVAHDGEKHVFSESQCHRFLSVDMAGSTKKKADWSVFMVIDVTPTWPRMAIVRDVKRIKIGTEAHEEALLTYAKRWGPKYIGIEDKTFGTNLANKFIAQHGYSIRKFGADVSKEFRALPIDNAIRNGLLFFLQGGQWRAEFDKELVKFPFGHHDDMVDALAHGYNHVLEMPRPKRKERRLTREEEIEQHALRGRQGPRGKRYHIPGVGRM